MIYNSPDSTVLHPDRDPFSGFRLFHSLQTFAIPVRDKSESAADLL